MIQADLHIHTAYSADASIQPKNLVDQLYAHSFIKTIAITDHNTIEGYHKVSKLASPYEDILIIPGIEVSTTEGDLIILGIPEVPQKPLTIGNVIDFSRERSGLVIVPHAYRANGLGDLAKEYKVDAIETLNGSSPLNLNRMAENLAKEMGLSGVAGSDAHTTKQLWTVYSEIQASSNIDEILKAIKQGFVKVASSPKSIGF